MNEFETPGKRDLQIFWAVVALINVVVFGATFGAGYLIGASALCGG